MPCWGRHLRMRSALNRASLLLHLGRFMARLPAPKMSTSAQVG